jgi:hypothetical protein
MQHTQVGMRFSKSYIVAVEIALDSHNHLETPRTPRKRACVPRKLNCSPKPLEGHDH